MSKYKYRWHRKTESEIHTDYVDAESKKEAGTKIAETWGGLASEKGGLRVLIDITECEKGI